MMLAVVTLLSGCAPDGFYADEEPIISSESSIIVEQVGSNEELSESPVPDVTNEPVESASPTVEPTESAESTTEPESTEVPVESAKPTEEPVATAIPVDVDGSVSGGDAVKTTGIGLLMSDGGSISLGEKTVTKENEDTLKLLENDVAVEVPIVDGYSILNDMVIGSTIELSIVPKAGYQIATYRLLIDSGEEVKSVLDFTTSPYQYEDSFEVIENLIIEVTFKSAKTTQDWLNSIINRIDEFDEYDIDLAGIYYQGENFYELVSMYEDPLCPLSDENWDSYLEYSGLEGLGYEEVKYLYEEGIELSELLDYPEVFYAAQPGHSGVSNYVRIVAGRSPKTAQSTGLPVIAQETSQMGTFYGMGFLKVNGINHFCIDHGLSFNSNKHFGSDEVEFTDFMKKAIIFYKKNHETTAHYVAAQLYIWCNLAGASFSVTYDELMQTSEWRTSLGNENLYLGTGAAVEAEIDNCNVNEFRNPCSLRCLDAQNWQRVICGDWEPIIIPPKGRIIVKKVDESGKPLAGCVFRVGSFATGKTWDLITDSSGTATLNDLDYGTYRVKEMQAPSKEYLVDPTPYWVTIPDENGSIVSTVQIVDKLKGREVEVTKYKQGTDIKVSAPGGLMQLFNVNTGELIAEWEPRYTFNSRLEAGDYRVHEAEAPSHYLV